MIDQTRPLFRIGDEIERLPVEGYPSVTPGRVYPVTRDEMRSSDGATVEIINDKGEKQVYGAAAFRLYAHRIQDYISKQTFTPAETPEEAIQTLTDKAFVDRRDHTGAAIPEPEPAKDNVLLPNHYAQYTLEPIRFIVENLGVTFLVGNAIKYLMRYKSKNGLEDLKKARRYVDMLIAKEEGREDWYTRNSSPKREAYDNGEID